MFQLPGFHAKSESRMHIAAITSLIVIGTSAVTWADDAAKAAQIEKSAQAQSKNADSPMAIDPSESTQARNEKPLSKSEIQKIREEWVSRFQGAVKKLKTASADEVERMETLIHDTKDPAALGPMAEVMGREAPAIRLLLDRTLAASDEPFAWVLLAERFLIEPDPEVRRSQIRILRAAESNKNYDIFLQHVKQAVASNNPVRAGLGAILVADLNWRERAPELLKHLAPVRLVAGITWVPEQVSQSSSGLSYGSVNGYAVIPVPVVGPGVVAYGQQIVPVGNSLSLGGGASASPRFQPVFRAGRQAQPNPAVLSALVRLTGVDFGYDVASWQKWMNTSFRVSDQTGKRVPTP